MALLNCYTIQEIVSLFPYGNLGKALINLDIDKENNIKHVLKLFNYKQKKFTRFIRPNNIIINKKIYNNFTGKHHYEKFIAGYSAKINYLRGIKWAMKIEISPYLNYVATIACENGHLEIIKFFASEVTNASLQNGIFACACGKNNLKIAKWIIKKWDIDELDFDFALICACLGGHLEIIKWLINKPYEYNFNCALEVACKGGHLEIVKWLIAEHKANNFETAFYSSYSGGQLEIAEWLMKTYNITIDYSKIIYEGCFKLNLKIVKWLMMRCKIKIDQIIEIINNNCYSNDFDVIKYFIKKRFNFDANKSLFNACIEGHFKIVKFIINNSNVTIRDYREALSKACKAGNFDIVEWLIKLDISKIPL